MSVNIKKIPKIFKILEYKQIADLLFSTFLINDYLHLMLTCKKIYNYLINRLNDSIKIIKDRFTNTYNDHLQWLSHTIRYQSLENYKIKLQFLIHFKIKLSKSDVYTLGCSYKIFNNNKEQLYFWKYQFMTVGSSTRSLWLYKQDIKKDFPYTADIIPVGSNDTLTLSIPYFCVQSLVDPHFINFYKLNKINNLSNLCSLQSTCQWNTYEYYENPLDFEVQDIIRTYPQNLRLKDIKISDIDIKIYRIELQCIKPMMGNLVGHKIIIKPKHQVLSIELKKKGSQDQRCKNLQFRVGDLLIIYINEVE